MVEAHTGLFRIKLDELWGIRIVEGVLSEWDRTMQDDDHVHVILFPQEYPPNAGRKKQQHTSGNA